MFTIDELVQPKTLNEAAAILTDSPDVVVLGGCGFLKLGSRRIRKAMDLSHCGLGSIVENTESIQIGAMATLYDIETYVSLRGLFNGIVSKAAGNILGTQFRRCATIGASVYSKYGFSDIIPPLMVLDTDVELLKNGRMPLKDFLDTPITRDILTNIFIKKDDRQASYQNMRNAGADFPILNAAVSKAGNRWTVAVGARPARAQIAEEASRQLSGMTEDKIDAGKIAAVVAQELSFSGNNKASAEYRRAISQVLVKRAIGEVLSCK